MELERLTEQKILRKENKTRGTLLPDFKLYNKAVAIQIVWHWHKNWHNINETEEKVQKQVHTYIWPINL